MPAPRLTDVEGIAAYLGLSEPAVRSMVKRGQIPHVKLGRTLRFDLRKIDRWIEARTVEVVL